MHHLPAEADTLAFGASLAHALAPGLVIHLQGELGAGKTTLVRGVLRGLGYAGRVKSPTFALVEPYKLSSLYLYHFDFYRFDDPLEWREAGLLEYFSEQAVCIVEWPERANGLPAADLSVGIQVTDRGRDVELCAGTEAGQECLERMQRHYQEVTGTPGGGSAGAR